MLPNQKRECRCKIIFPRHELTDKKPLLQEFYYKYCIFKLKTRVRLKLDKYFILCNS